MTPTRKLVLFAALAACANFAAAVNGSDRDECRRQYNHYGKRTHPGSCCNCYEFCDDMQEGAAWGSHSPRAFEDFWVDDYCPERHGQLGWYYGNLKGTHRYPYAFRPTLYHRYNGSVDLTGYAPPLREYRLWHNGVDNYLRY